MSNEQRSQDADWFYETNELWSGQAFGLRVKNRLYSGRTKFQEVEVFESTDYGNVLVLDGVIQATERDEFAYQEMISHIPLLSHPNPLKVLIIGGGDGGCVREVLKHKNVETVELVEIDQTVIDLSRKYLPSMASSLDDPRVTVHITDGFEFLRNCKPVYDVVISDTSDPEGPAEALFQEGFFKLLKGVLTPNGVCSMQASENVWLKLDVLQDLKRRLSNVFEGVFYSAVTTPTYTSGQLGLMICTRGPDCRTPVRQDQTLDVRYYTADMHKASFVLPQFAKRYLLHQDK